MAAIEQVASEDSPSRLGHLERLEEIYCSLLGPAATRRRCVGKRRPVGACQGIAYRRGRQRARLDRMRFQKVQIDPRILGSGLGRPGAKQVVNSDHDCLHL